MPYPLKEKHVVSLKIPDGWQVEALPESSKIALPDGGGLFSFFCSERQGMIQTVCDLSVKQTYFTTEEYGSLKYFFDLFIEKMNEQIVFSKS